MKNITKFFGKKVESMEESIDLAKRLYFTNYANHMTMKKNGEYEEYMKYHIPPNVEYEWSIRVKDQLVEEIVSGENILHVYSLSRVNLPECEILAAFKSLAASQNKNNILKAIIELKRLFDPSMYERIIEMFTCS